jgi:hypothetical protein
MKRKERTRARRFFKEFHPSAQPGEFDRWLAYVTEIDVQLHPGGRAILTHPEANLRVQIRWDAAGVQSVHVDAQPGDPFPSVEISLSRFLAALELKRGAWASGTVASISQSLPALTQAASGEVIVRPMAGKRPSLAFFRQIEREYNELVSAAEPVRNPVNEIARRHHVQPGTVKSWLHRGRKYLKEEG